MADQLTAAQFAASIKAKYPDYANVPDDELTTKILAKYPEYRERVNVQPATDERSAGQRFAEGAASQLNPVAAVKGVAQAVTHPIDTLGAIVQSHIDQAKKAKQAYDEGRYTEAAGHLGAAALPVVGPAAAGIGERIAATGDVATGVGEGAGLIASMAVPKAVPAVVRAGGRAAGAVGEAVQAAVEHPITQAVAQRAVKHGSTVAGAVAGSAVGGPAGAFLGGAAGRELGATIAERMAARAKQGGKAPVAASSAEVVADLASGRPMDASAYIEKLNTLTPDERAAVIQARQTAVRAGTKAETPAELTKRTNAEHRAQFSGQGAAPAAPGDLMEQFQATQGPKQEILQPNAEGGVTRMRMNAEGSHVAVPEAPEPTPAPVGQQPPTAEIAPPAQPGPAEPPTSFNPSKAFTEARKAFADAGETVKPGEMSWVTEYIRRGLSPKQAVQKVIQTRQGVAATADPAAQLAARLGTPSPEAVAEAVRVRNTTGRWAAR